MANGWTCCNTAVKHEKTCENYISPWISIKDRLPKDEGFYFVRASDTFIKTRKFGVVGLNRCLDEKLRWQDFSMMKDFVITSEEITHWMPIPPLPVEGGE